MCGVDVRAVSSTGRCSSAAFARRWPASSPAFYIGNISFGTGLVFGLKILFVTAVGGYLSPPRAALGAAAFGMAESLWSGYFPVEWRDAWMYLFLVAHAGAAAPGETRARSSDCANVGRLGCDVR